MDATILGTQLSSAAMVVYMMQRLKNASWFPWLVAGKAKLSRSISIIIAFFVHIGIGYTWDPVLDASGNRHLSLAIPAAGALAVGVWHWFNQFVMQELVYQVTANKITPTTTPNGPTIPARVDSSGQMIVPAADDK